MLLPRCARVGGARLTASLSALGRYRTAPGRRPRREGRRRPLGKERRCAAHVLWLAPRRARTDGRGFPTRHPASTKNAGLPGRRPAGLVRPPVLGSLHRGEGGGRGLRETEAA